MWINAGMMITRNQKVKIVFFGKPLGNIWPLAHSFDRCSISAASCFLLCSLSFNGYLSVHTVVSDCKQHFQTCYSTNLMFTTATDDSKPRNLFSFVNFGSSSRRRSISLPMRSDDDSFEKADRYTQRSSTDQTLKAMAMNQSSRSRFLKYGGVVAFFLILILFFGRDESARVGEFMGGIVYSFCICVEKLTRSHQVHLLHKQATG